MGGPERRKQRRSRFVCKDMKPKNVTENPVKTRDTGFQKKEGEDMEGIEVTA